MSCLDPSMKVPRRALYDELKHCKPYSSMNNKLPVNVPTYLMLGSVHFKVSHQGQAFSSCIL